MSEDVDIKIKFSKEGDAARQAKKEIEDLKNATDNAASSKGNLNRRTSALSGVLSGLTGVLNGTVTGVRALIQVVAGLFQTLVSHPIIKLISVLSMLGVAVYQLYQKFVLGKKGAKELAEEQRLLEANIKALKDVPLPFENVQRDLDAITKKYRTAVDAAKALQAVQDELADASLATRLAGLDLEEEQALSAAGDDETRRTEIRHEYAQKKLAARYEREAEKAKTEQAERSRVTMAAVNEKEELEKELAEIDAAAQSHRDRIERIEQSPYLQSTLSTDIIEGNKRAMKEFEAAANSVRERLVELNREIKTSEIAERAALERRSTIDLEYQTATKRATREHQEGVSRRQKIEAKEEEAAAKEAEKQETAAAREAAEPLVSMILQQQRAEEQSAKVRYQATQRAAGAKGLTAKQRQAADAAADAAQQEYHKESADVAVATAYAEKIKAAVDPEEIARLLEALEAIGNNVNSLVSETSAKANQVANQIRNGGMRM